MLPRIFTESSLTRVPEFGIGANPSLVGRKHGCMFVNQGPTVAAMLKDKCRLPAAESFFFHFEPSLLRQLGLRCAGCRRIAVNPIPVGGDDGHIAVDFDVAWRIRRVHALAIIEHAFEFTAHLGPPLYRIRERRIGPDSDDARIGGVDSAEGLYVGALPTVDVPVKRCLHLSDRLFYRRAWSRLFRGALVRSVGSGRCARLRLARYRET